MTKEKRQTIINKEFFIGDIWRENGNQCEYGKRES